jgi:hypothetical protein
LSVITSERFGERSRADRVVLAITAIALAYAVYSGVRFALQDDVRHLLVRIVDDASYYFTTARNLADGRGLTFDGIHPSNGFHPLWLLMLVPLFLLHEPPETMIRLVALLQTVLLGIAYLVFWRTQSKLFSPRTAALTAILFAGLVFPLCINGMESALLVLLVTMLYGYGLHIAQTQPNWQRAALLGIIVGCVVLARLDMIFIALCLFGWLARCCLPVETRSRAVALVLVCGLAAAAVVGPWLAFNYLEFGSAMPISGALKSSFPHTSLGPYTLPRLAAMGIIYLGSAILAVCWSLWTVIRTRSKTPSPDSGSYTAATAIFAWAVTTHFIYTMFFVREDTFAWYFVIYPLFAIVLVSGPIERMLSSKLIRTRPVVYPATAALLIVAVIVRDQTRDSFPQNGQWHTPAYNAAVWAREHTPPEAIFAMSDCGHFAFFSLRRVINLDGLTNNFDFQHTLAEHRLNQYLRQNEVDFLVKHAAHGEDVIQGDYSSLTLPYPSKLFRGLGDSVRVEKESEVYRSPRFIDGRYPSVLVIWSLRGN